MATEYKEWRDRNGGKGKRTLAFTYKLWTNCLEEKMDENYKGYINLLLAVTKEKKENLLPLNKKDIEEIDELLESLGKGGIGAKFAFKDALNLRFGLKGGQFTIRQTAKLLGVSPAAVRVKVILAILRLQRPSKIKQLKKFFRV